MTATRNLRANARGLKLVVGDGPAKTGANMAMAVRLGTYARAVGSRVKNIRQSRSSGSSSVYITFQCPAGRIWNARISNHHRPKRSCIPNFDLVSHDGVRGEPWLADCIAAASVGYVDWFDSKATARAPSARDKKLISKSRGKNRFSGRAAKRLPC